MFKAGFALQGLPQKGFQEVYRMVIKNLGALGQRGMRAAKTTCQVVSFHTPPSVLWADMSPGPLTPGPQPGLGSGLHLSDSRGTLPCRSTCSAHILPASTMGIPPETQEAREREHLRATRAVNLEIHSTPHLPVLREPLSGGLGLHATPILGAIPSTSLGTLSQTPSRSPHGCLGET